MVRVALTRYHFSSKRRRSSLQADDLWVPLMERRLVFATDFPPLYHHRTAQQQRLQATGAAADGDDEGRFRHLAFKEEEGRVRDGTDTYVPGHAGLGRELKRLRAERDRLARA